jgi:hypothetical protein
MAEHHDPLEGVTLSDENQALIDLAAGGFLGPAAEDAAVSGALLDAVIEKGQEALDTVSGFRGRLDNWKKPVVEVEPVGTTPSGEVVVLVTPPANNTGMMLAAAGGVTALLLLLGLGAWAASR